MTPKAPPPLQRIYAVWLTCLVAGAVVGYLYSFISELRSAPADDDRRTRRQTYKETTAKEEWSALRDSDTDR